MFRAARIERVLAEIVGTLEQPKPRRRDDNMDVAAHRADRAIAILDLERIR